METSDLIQKIKLFFKEKIDQMIVFLGFLVLIYILILSCLTLYHLIYPKKVGTFVKKFEINQFFYQEVSKKLEEKSKINDQAIAQKIDPLSDPFEKK